MTPLESVMAETLRNLHAEGDITFIGVVEVITTTAERLAPLGCFDADVMLEAVFGVKALLDQREVPAAFEAGMRIAKKHLAELTAVNPRAGQKPFDRTCPSCRAVPGGPCFNMQGKPMKGYHANRLSGVQVTP